MDTTFEVIEVPEQPTAVIRATVPMDQLTSLYDRAYPLVFAAVARQGRIPAGAPFGYYLHEPTEAGVELEVGVPVSDPITEDGEVVASSLPAGRVVHGVHVGSYDSLADTYAAMARWAADEGLTVGNGMWECYLTDPSAQPDPADWRTEVFIRLT